MHSRHALFSVIKQSCSLCSYILASIFRKKRASLFFPISILWSSGGRGEGGGTTFSKQKKTYKKQNKRRKFETENC